ncbi:glycosyltransferase family A protein [Selenomonas sp. F0473]|uniref:glycosyltransferase family 2 protein n=1 Tax=Selenomonas sp. F0473 TaxID=999423 RepID=UPI00029EA2E9|nr:glycosyltransferase family A protein [Selenomonas sp. F0473]EKU70817.1 hypothetical protein HMPREF9161_01366 [Selenomonas sp. F0473]
MPFFSIIVPTKARPRLIDIALYSLHHQTFCDFEVIVTDDYDDPRVSCKDIVENYHDSRFIYVHPPDIPVLGMCGNWEYGLQFASGKYIGFMQDKMYMYADSLEKLYKSMLSADMPDMANWGWDFYDLIHKDSTSFQGVLHMKEKTCTWEKKNPEEEIQKKLEFRDGNYQFEGGIPGTGSPLAGVLKKEILYKLKNTYGAIFNYFNPDYGPPILILSAIKTLIFIKDNLYVLIPTRDSEGVRHSISYAAACKFQELSPCGVERLKYATVPGLRITNTNMISADYNYTMQLLHRKQRCNEQNVLLGIVIDADLVKYEHDNDYEAETVRLRQHCIDRQISLSSLYKQKAAIQKEEWTLKTLLRTMIFKAVPKRFQPSVRAFLLRKNDDKYYSSPKKSVFRQ